MIVIWQFATGEHFNSKINRCGSHRRTTIWIVVCLSVGDMLTSTIINSTKDMQGGKLN